MAMLDLFRRGPGRPRKSEGARASDAKEWLRRIDRAREVKQKWATDFRVKLAYEYWENRSRPSHFSADEWICVNLLFSSLMAELPGLYSVDPYFYVKLKRSFRPNALLIALYEQRGRIRQSMLNYLKDEVGLKPKARLAIFDAFFQFGVVKIHTAADLLENPQRDVPLSGEDGETLKGSDGQELFGPETLPANQAYKLTRVHPSDFLVDEDAGPVDPDDVAWKAQRWRKSLAAVQADKRYKKAVRIHVKATELKPEDLEREARKKGGLASSNRGDRQKPDIVVGWEIYDLRRGESFVVVDGFEDDFLREPEPLPPGMDGDPFAELRFILRDDSWYPYPPVSVLLDPQREYCESRSFVMRHRKNVANRKFYLQSDAFDRAEDEAAKLVNGEDGTVLIASRSVGFPPVGPIADAPLDQQVHVELAYLRKDFDDLATGANQRGSAQGVDSATEAGILEKRYALREGDRLSIVADWMGCISRKLDQQVQANITKDHAIKVTGPQGEFWETVRVSDYDEIDGEYEYSISAGATTPQLPEIERAQFNAALGLFASNPILLLSKNLIKKELELHHIGDDDALVEELYQLGQLAMSGAAPATQRQGSQPGAPDMTTMGPSRMGGMAAGMNNVRGGMQ